MRASGYERNDFDYYVEPPWAVDGLLEVEKLYGVILDPACGSGTIPKQIIAAGHHAIGSDIEDRGYGRTGVSVFDLDMEVDVVVSNPPYGVLEEFVIHALKLAKWKVIVLARLAFLEGQRRREFFANNPLARVWVSRRRISMPPGGRGIEAKGGTAAYAWFVFEHGHRGPPTIGWFDAGPDTELAKRRSRRRRQPELAIVPA